MDYLTEIKTLIEEQNGAFDQFKSNFGARLDAIENAEAKSRRPNGGALERLADNNDPELKAFRAFMRTGDMEQKSLSTGSGPDGGYSVPKVIDGMIESLIVNISPIRSIASVQQVSTQDFHKLVNLRGTASGWVGETQARNATNTPQLVDVAPPMGDLYAYPQATQQMLDDSFFNAEQWLSDNISTEFARAEGAAFVSGIGVNQPSGFLSGPAPVTTSDATRAFGTLQYLPSTVSGGWSATASAGADLLMSLIFSLKAGYRQNAKFVMNKTTLSSISTMKDSSGRYILTPMQGPTVPATIFGHQVVECEDMPSYTTANALAVAFGDFSRGYLIVDRIGTRILRDPFTNRPYIGFYAVKRVGGALQNSEAIKLIKFSAS